MTIEEPEPSSTSDNILGLIGESISYFPTFFDDPYDTGDFIGDSWWVDTQYLEQEFINSSPSSFTTNNTTATITSTTTTPTQSLISNQSQLPDLPKKRKTTEDPNPKLPRKNTKRHEAGPEQADVAPPKKSTQETRQGFNTSSFYGLRALTHHLSAVQGSNFLSSANSNNFASSNPKFFRDSLIKFNDINPWFRIPNNVANTSILQILGEQNSKSNLHILDIGVSHGVQWPTLLEELTRRAGGPPPLVRLTAVAPSNQSTFTNGPSNYDLSSKLLNFAEKMNINLQINKLENLPLQNLSSQVINASAEETLVVCAQFRLHNLNHSIPDERTEFLRVLRSLQPKGVILSENNTDCSCCNCGDFATGFLRRVEYLWRFLDSTSAAYKGRESDDRRMMEAEAAKVLVDVGEMNERKERWCERMMSVGFKGEVFGEETVDGAKALLRKYDNNWEIRVEERDGCIGLWWKGQPVSFCSLWKMDL